MWIDQENKAEKDWLSRIFGTNSGERTFVRKIIVTFRQLEYASVLQMSWWEGLCKQAGTQAKHLPLAVTHHAT